MDDNPQQQPVATEEPPATELTVEQAVVRLMDERAESKRRMGAIETQLQALLHTLGERLPPAPAYTPPGPNSGFVPAPPPHLSNAAPTQPAALDSLAVPAATSRAPKPASPPNFDGTRSKGRAFLTACRIYLALAGQVFPSEAAQVMWALSFLNEGRASRFAQRALRARDGAAEFDLTSWSSFQTAFTKEFCEQNEAETAQLALEGTSYFQGRRTVEEYVDDFKDMVVLSGYSDQAALILKFRKGLLPSLDMQVANLPAESRPSTLDGWYQL